MLKIVGALSQSLGDQLRSAFRHPVAELTFIPPSPIQTFTAGEKIYQNDPLRIEGSTVYREPLPEDWEKCGYLVAIDFAEKSEPIRCCKAYP